MAMPPDDLDVDPARLLCLPAAEPVLARAAEAKSGAALGFLLLDLKAWVEAARELLHKALVHPPSRQRRPSREGRSPGCGVGAPDVGQGPGLVHHLPEAGKGWVLNANVRGVETTWKQYIIQMR